MQELRPLYRKVLAVAEYGKEAIEQQGELGRHDDTCCTQMAGFQTHFAVTHVFHRVVVTHLQRGSVYRAPAGTQNVKPRKVEMI